MQALQTTVATVLALFLAIPATSQQQLPNANKSESVAKKGDVKPGVTGKAPFVFEAGEVDLLELIERCGAYLHFNILIDPSSELQNLGRRRGGGRAAPKNAPAVAAGPVVSLQLPVVTDHDGCEELLSSVLWSQGLALIALDEKKSVYEVLSRQGSRAREIVASSAQRSPDQVLARPMLRSYVTTVMQLKHINAQLANNSLRPFYASSGQQGRADSLMIGNVGNKSSVLISGPQFMVARALKMLQEADVPATELPNLIEKRFGELAQQNEALRQRVEQLERRLNTRK